MRATPSAKASAGARPRSACCPLARRVRRAAAQGSAGGEARREAVGRGGILQLEASLSQPHCRPRRPRVAVPAGPRGSGETTRARLQGAVARTLVRPRIAMGSLLIEESHWRTTTLRPRCAAQSTMTTTTLGRQPKRRCASLGFMPSMAVRRSRQVRRWRGQGGSCVPIMLSARTPSRRLRVPLRRPTRQRTCAACKRWVPCRWSR